MHSLVTTEFVLTYVVIIGNIIISFMHDESFHSKLLLTTGIRFINGTLSQVYGQMCEFGILTEQKPNTQMCKHVTHQHEWFWNYSAMTSLEEITRCFVFSPIREAVSCSENPAWWNESATTEEAIALMKNGSNPWLRLYRCERASYNFMNPPLRCLSTCFLWKDTWDKSAGANKENHTLWFRKNWI